MIEIVLSDHALDTPAMTALLRRADCGAVATFEGTVRSPNEGLAVNYLFYEAYDSVATAQMRCIAQEVLESHDLRGVAIAHRLGRVHPGDVAFFVATCSPHRRGALDATSHIVDRVKAEAAIWKQEVTEVSSRWVETMTSKASLGSGDIDE